MKAIILAAGEGKRLRPLTNRSPKCLVKIFGKSILEWQINTFRNCPQIENIVVVTGYKDDKIKLPNITKYVNKNYDSTNMLESLFCARNELNDSVIVSYGDILFEKRILQSLIESNYDISVVIDKNWRDLWNVRMKKPIDDVESLRMDSNGFIVDIGQKVSNLQDIEGQYIGLMKFQGKGLESVLNFYDFVKKESQITGKNPLNPALPFSRSYLTDFIRGLIDSEYKVKAIPTNSGWIELDSYRDYVVYNNLYGNGTLSKLIHLGEL